VKVAVCIPWRETPERVRAYRWAVERWRRITGWPVVSEDSPTSYWSKAVAGNRTVDRALVQHAPDVLFVVDADLVLLDPQSIAERALRDGWAVGHDRLLRLSESASDRLLASAPDVEVREEHFGRDRAGRKEVKRTVPALLGDTALAITPDAWEYVGGFDERFKEWGGQQVSVGHAARVLLGEIEQPNIAAYHFWHGPITYKSRSDHPYYKANASLARRYSSTRTVEGMLRLVSEEGRRG